MEKNLKIEEKKIKCAKDEVFQKMRDEEQKHKYVQNQ